MYVLDECEMALLSLCTISERCIAERAAFGITEFFSLVVTVFGLRNLYATARSFLYNV